jgi:hypothetical protein
MSTSPTDAKQVWPKPPPRFDLQKRVGAAFAEVQAGGS